MRSERIDVLGHDGMLFTDDDGDSVSVSDAIFAANSLLVTSTNKRGQDTSVYLSLDAVSELQSFLSSWLIKKGIVPG